MEITYNVSGTTHAEVQGTAAAIAARFFGGTAGVTLAYAPAAGARNPGDGWTFGSTVTAALREEPEPAEVMRQQAQRDLREEIDGMTSLQAIEVLHHVAMISPQVFGQARLSAL